MMIKKLTDTKLEDIHECWVEAFSDYQVKINMPFSLFESMLSRRGFEAEISMGAFNEEKLVGFILNGNRNWNNKPTAYDLSTAVRPSFRKKGITSSMFKDLLPILQSQGIVQYLLEVLKPNEGAISLYKKNNFKVTRSLRCFRTEIKNVKTIKNSQLIEKSPITAKTLESLTSFWDFTPSWQNSIDSVIADKDNMSMYTFKENNIIKAYGILKNKTGDITQLAVSKDFRRKGIASAIVSEMIKNCERDRFGVINIEEGFSDIDKFYEAIGFKNEIDQYEMLLTL